MRMNTEWYGIQILAETEKDKEILQGLVDSLLKESISAYERGLIRIIDGEAYLAYEDDVWPFTADEVKSAKLMVRIDR